jgi:hypothetical protein
VRYVYVGPGPVEDPDDHTIVRPGDEREMESCAWGPWECLAAWPEPDGAEMSAGSLGTPVHPEPHEDPPAGDSASDNSTEA